LFRKEGGGAVVSIAGTGQTLGRHWAAGSGQQAVGSRQWAAGSGQQTLQL
jgi:hypothetical protein